MSGTSESFDNYDPFEYRNEAMGSGCSNMTLAVVAVIGAVIFILIIMYLPYDLPYELTKKQSAPATPETWRSVRRAYR